MKEDRGKIWFLKFKITIVMSCSSEFSSEVAVISYFFIILRKFFFTNILDFYQQSVNSFYECILMSVISFFESV